MPRVIFLPDNIAVERPEGSSLLEAARLAGVYVETPCGGKGTCQKCRVRMSVADTIREVLICQTLIPSVSEGDDPVTVEIPASSRGQSAGAGGQFENFEEPYKYLNESNEPFLKKVKLRIASPAPLDGLSDADRFSRDFLKTLTTANAANGQAVEYRTVELPLDVLAVLPQKLREADGEISVFYYIDNNIAKVVRIVPCSPAIIPHCYGLAVDIGTTT
ncbi:MAG: 2Fe-2S iron-sulfur cluster-binding protein, partial [Treponema sp.]|nr:2Fe-2S iron-sulfur cluster-binding protein [Treponema sp.]